MKKLVLVACCAAIRASCGERVDEIGKRTDAISQLSEHGERMAEMMADGETVDKERAVAGDTIAMPYEELERFLPSSINGYRREGQSSATRQWVSGEDGGARITIQIADWGGTQNAYGGASLGLAAIGTEDEKQRVESLTLGPPMTSGVATFDKEDRSASVTAERAIAT